MHPKQDYPLNRDPPSRRFSYSQNIDSLNKQNIESACSKCSGKIRKEKEKLEELTKMLEQQEIKYKMLEEATVQEQMLVLDQINILQERFIQVTREKDYYREQIASFDQDFAQYQKIKGIAGSLIRMMEKIEGYSGDLHSAWKWVKKVVMEHQTIKKKALQWKQGYDAYVVLSNTLQSDNQQVWERNRTFGDQNQQF